jgi:hypothetical protein
MRVLRLLASILVALLMPCLASAEDTWRVERVIGDNSAGLTDEVTVEVTDLGALLDKANCVTAAPDCKQRNVALFLNGMPLLGIQPVPDREHDRLRYTLKRNEQNKAVWAALLGCPSQGMRPLQLSVGLEGGDPLPSRVDRFNLIVLRPGYTFVAISLIVLILVGLCWAGWKSMLLRDPGTGLPAADEQDGKRRRIRVPFSLARVQMAWWLFLIVSSYLFIWLTTGQSDSLNARVLILLGIGTGTVLGGAVIDSSKKTGSLEAVKGLTAEQGALAQKVAELGPPQTGVAPDLELVVQRALNVQRSSEVDAELKKATASLEPSVSRNLFLDILSDATGVAFYRFQLLVWTIVLGFVFCAAVYEDLAMPQLSDSMLGLMGITSGTYLGIKLPERR